MQLEILGEVLDQFQPKSNEAKRTFSSIIKNLL